MGRLGMGKGSHWGKAGNGGRLASEPHFYKFALVRANICQTQKGKRRAEISKGARRTREEGRKGGRKGGRKEGREGGRKGGGREEGGREK